MINRELIRIKTIQLLYSYLLVENPFSIESQPSAPTKEKRFAYSLYLDILLLLTRIARDVDPRGGRPLEDTRFVRYVMADDRIKSLLIKYEHEEFPFSRIAKDLAGKVKESGIYRNFIKDEERHAADENVWKEIFEYVVMPDPELNREIERRENYTLKGVDRMRGMMETTFSNFFASVDNIPDALKELDYSMKKTREFYFRLLALPIAITDLREREIDNARHKLLRNADDINPNTRFVDNEFVRFLKGNDELQNAITEFRIDWLAENESLVRSLLKTITQSSVYQEYLEFPVTDFKTDCDFWKNIYRNVIFIDENFLQEMENRSVFWNDDLDVIGTFIMKSIKRLAEAGPDSEEGRNFVLPMFKDNEDSLFGAQLFADVIRRKDFYRNLILENIDKSQWEMERLAFMDSVILMTAIAEIVNFPKIPLTVSFNEYIEIAKYYSTPRSGVFINGLLGKIVASMQERHLIYKTFNTKQ